MSKFLVLDLKSEKVSDALKNGMQIPQNFREFNSFDEAFKSQVAHEPNRAIIEIYDNTKINDSFLDAKEIKSISHDSDNPLKVEAHIKVKNTALYNYPAHTLSFLNSGMADEILSQKELSLLFMRFRDNHVFAQNIRKDEYKCARDLLCGIGKSSSDIASGIFKSRYGLAENKYLTTSQLLEILFSNLSDIKIEDIFFDIDKLFNKLGLDRIANPELIKKLIKKSDFIDYLNKNSTKYTVSIFNRYKEIFRLNNIKGVFDNEIQFCQNIIDIMKETIEDEKKEELQSDRVKRCTRDAEPVLFNLTETKVGMYETINFNRRNSKQQDALIAFNTPEFKNITPDDRCETLRQTVKSLQKNHGSKYINDGSTLAGTVFWKENDTIKTYTASIGDSTSYIVILDEHNQLKRVEQLNDYLHNMENEKEVDRVIKNGGIIYDNRVGGSLAVTGSLGDIRQETAGLTHIPYIREKEFKLNPGERAFLVVACDGLIESKHGVNQEGKLKVALEGLRNKEIGQLISDHHNKEPHQLAELLIREALSETTSLSGEERAKHPTTDNVSVAVMEITNNEPVGTFVFDGHGHEGEKVSNDLATHFYPVLSHKISKKIEIKASYESGSPRLFLNNTILNVKDAAEAIKSISNEKNLNLSAQIACRITDLFKTYELDPYFNTQLFSPEQRKRTFSLIVACMEKDVTVRKYFITESRYKNLFHTSPDLTHKTKGNYF